MCPHESRIAREQGHASASPAAVHSELAHADLSEFLDCEIDQCSARTTSSEGRLDPPFTDDRDLIAQVDGQVPLDRGVYEPDDLPLLLSHHQRRSRVLTDLTDPTKEPPLGIGVKFSSAASSCCCRRRCCRSIGKTAWWSPTFASA